MRNQTNKSKHLGQGFDVFISYSSVNKLTADAMKQFLQAKGIRCWKAPDDIIHGESWAKAIPRAIRMARLMVLIWTKDSMRSEQVINELTLADRSKKLVIPFRTESIEPEDEFEYYLAKTHWLDAFSDDLADSFELLADRILLNLSPMLGAQSNDSRLPQSSSDAREIPGNEVTRAEDRAALEKLGSWNENLTPSEVSAVICPPEYSESLPHDHATANRVASPVGPSRKVDHDQSPTCNNIQHQSSTTSSLVGEHSHALEERGTQQPAPQITADTEPLRICKMGIELTKLQLRNDFYNLSPILDEHLIIESLNESGHSFTLLDGEIPLILISAISGNSPEEVALRLALSTKRLCIYNSTSFREIPWQEISREAVGMDKIKLYGDIYEADFLLWRLDFVLDLSKLLCDKDLASKIGLQVYDAQIEFAQAELNSINQSLADERDAYYANVNRLGILYLLNENAEQAEELFRETLAGRTQYLGETHPDSMLTRYCLAEALSHQEKYEEAIELRRIELEWCRTAYGNTDLDIVCSLYRIGCDLLELEYHDEALAMLSECYKKQFDIHGSHHESTLRSLGKILKALSGLNRAEEAIKLAETSLSDLPAELGDDTPTKAELLHALGGLYHQVGLLDKAESAYQRCLVARARYQVNEYDRSLDDDETLETLYMLANVYLDKDCPWEAEKLLRRCMEDPVRLSQDPGLAAAISLASLCFKVGRLDEAESILRRCMERCERELGKDAGEVLTLCSLLARVLGSKCQYQDAASLWRKLLDRLRLEKGDKDVETLDCISMLAINLRELGKHVEAELLFRELLVSSQEILGPGDSQIGRALGGLAKTLEAAGKLEEAADYAKQCLEHRTAYEGPDSCFTNRNRLDLARILHKLERNQEALTLLDDLQTSLNANPEQDDDDRELLSDAVELRGLIAAKP